MLPGGFHARSTEEFDDARRGAGGEGTREFLHESTDTLGAEAIDVFVGGHPVEDFGLG